MQQEGGSDGTATAPTSGRAAPRFDPALVGAGRAAFNSACTQCHDAERALSKRKDLPGWRATVRRMAGKSGADVPQGDWEAIATYLASLGAPTGGITGGGAGREEQQLSVWATLSPLFREGNDKTELPGFFPMIWLGANWQSRGALSARVTACTTCHVEAGNGHRIELVEGALRLDLAKCLMGRDTQVKANLDAGRFIVPFGAFSSQVNPGVYRTVSTPLIFTMGQRVLPTDIGDPVLPMPYADQGALINFAIPVAGETTATMDAYVVNGLRGSSSGIDFFQSRNWVDNSKEPGVGGRWTVGNQFLRFGTSVTAGRFNDDAGSGPLGKALYYRIYGADVVARYEDIWRFQFEYANRDSDRLLPTKGTPLINEHVGGYYFETELLVHRGPKISILGRYDVLNRASSAPPPGSSLPIGSFAVTRATLGVNTVLPGGSLLMLNWERWQLPAGLHELNVYGIRWAATF